VDIDENISNLSFPMQLTYKETLYRATKSAPNTPGPGGFSEVSTEEGVYDDKMEGKYRNELSRSSDSIHSSDSVVVKHGDIIQNEKDESGHDMDHREVKNQEEMDTNRGEGEETPEPIENEEEYLKKKKLKMTKKTNNNNMIKIKNISKSVTDERNRRKSVMLPQKEREELEETRIRSQSFNILHKSKIWDNFEIDPVQYNTDDLLIVFKDASKKYLKLKELYEEEQKKVTQLTSEVESLKTNITQKEQFYKEDIEKLKYGHILEIKKVKSHYKKKNSERK